MSLAELDPIDLPPADPMAERAIFRAIVDLVAIGRYQCPSAMADDLLRGIDAIARNALSCYEESAP